MPARLGLQPGDKGLRIRIHRPVSGGHDMVGGAHRNGAVGEERNEAAGGQVVLSQGALGQRYTAAGNSGIDDQGRLVEADTAIERNRADTA